VRRVPSIMRPLASLFISIACGCATSLQGGAQTAVQTAGPASQEATFAAGAGFGDGRWALLMKARGALGVDARTGRRIGSVSGGYEWVGYGERFEDVTTGRHFGVYLGARFAQVDASWMLVTAEYGWSWIIGRSAPSEDTNGYSVTSLALTPMLGFAFKTARDGPHDGAVVGLSFGVRYDSFSEWRFHF
jgi:hypothetical protein